MAMRYHYLILSALSFGAAVLFAFAAFAQHAPAPYDPFGPPIFAEPTFEMHLAAALRDDMPMPATDPTLNERLRSINIRTALEDHRRLHWDLG